MSILPVLGHKPITSYFSKRKRKEVDNSGSFSQESVSKKPRQSARKWANSGHSSVPKRSLVAESSFQRCRGDELKDTSPTSPSPRLSTCTSYQPSGMSLSFSTPPMPELIIPSSQSQCMEVDMLSPFTKWSGNLLRPIEGEGIIIESSQSQLLIMASPNMQKLELEPTLPSFDIVIPSSQSQEEELTIPTKKDLETGVGGRYPIGTQRGFEIPQTISGESFFVSTRDSILDNLLSDEQELDTPPAGNNLDSVNPVTLADSETEDEFEDLPNSFRKERSLDPSATRSSGDLESSLGTGSYSSLPPEVWEFRKMFENGDGSYPADFPESLRS